MTGKKIHLKSIDDVKKFVSIVQNYEGNVDLQSGKYVIDAKSILGIFSLDISKPLDMKIDMKESECKKLWKELGEFVIAE